MRDSQAAKAEKEVLEGAEQKPGGVVHERALLRGNAAGLLF
jgi:hypothetical protein